MRSWRLVVCAHSPQRFALRQRPVNLRWIGQYELVNAATARNRTHEAQGRHDHHAARCARVLAARSEAADGGDVEALATQIEFALLMDGALAFAD